MRTDSTRVSPVAVDAAKEYIRSSFGEEYLPKLKRSYKTGAGAQDAHEAIRPSNIALEPKLVKRLLSTEQYRLYKLIWERFIASQMEACVLDTVVCELDNNGYIFKTGGYVVKSRGYLAVYEKDDIEQDGEYESLQKLPSLKKGQTFDSFSVKTTQHFTEPPARYTEASLIKFLEENGIGRPSTYAPIISIIIGREYVKREGKSLVATPLGEITTRFMRKYFPEIIDYEFTASMETKLDSIEMKKNTISGVISDFYKNFAAELDVALSEEHTGEFEMPKEESDVLCDRCGRPMLVKNGRFGKFLACSGYPDCKNTMTLDKDGNPAKPVVEEPTFAGFKCDICGGEMIVRNGRYGIFYACSNYPTCTFTKHKTTELDVPCPVCGHKIVARHGKGKMLFYSCEMHPDCGFSSWDMPLAEKCPDCGGMLFYRKSRKSVICKEKGCEYKREEEMTVIE
jgi:DNA topoisomerase-1